MEEYKVYEMPVLSARRVINERVLIGIAYAEPIVEEGRRGYSFLFLWEDGSDYSKVSDVTGSVQTAKMLFDRLVDGEIFPCHLRDAILDFLGE